uniref:Uncharacterized protein n=1 Tax=Cacopsylla melanoneura TaxID=428564 RepID=A0A8D9FGV3_9HEMI
MYKFYIIYRYYTLLPQEVLGVISHHNKVLETLESNCKLVIIIIYSYYVEARKRMKLREMDKVRRTEKGKEGALREKEVDKLKGRKNREKEGGKIAIEVRGVVLVKE